MAQILITIHSGNCGIVGKCRVNDEYPQVPLNNSRGKNMGKEEFRQALFDLATFATKHELSDQAKKLIIHYFNESDGHTSTLRGIRAIQRYFPDCIPPEGERSKRLQMLIDEMAVLAEEWDRE